MLLVAALAACSGKHEYRDNRGLEGQLEREVVALHQRVRQLEAELLVCAEGTNDPLYGELHQLFTGTEVAVDRINATTLLTMPGAYVFADPYELRLRDEARMSLDLLATALAVNPDYEVRVVGHTHNRPVPDEWSEVYGDGLDVSMEMAEVVARTLMEEFELAPGRFSVAGRGAFDPVRSNDVPEGQAANQRIELHVFPRTSR